MFSKGCNDFPMAKLNKIQVRGCRGVDKGGATTVSVQIAEVVMADSLED